MKSNVPKLQQVALLVELLQISDLNMTGISDLNMTDNTCKSHVKRLKNKQQCKKTTALQPRFNELRESSDQTCRNWDFCP